MIIGFSAGRRRLQVRGRHPTSGPIKVHCIPYLDPAELRRNVTSPGGTTAAALQVLMGEDGLQELMTRAVKAATARSQELSE